MPLEENDLVLKVSEMIRFRQTGDFSKTTKFFDYVSNGKYLDNILNKYGQKGVLALAAGTPKDTGLTASSWTYEIHRYQDGNIQIVWKNSNVNNDWFNVAMYLQYGHGTRNGGWVEGIDYINPAMRPIFDGIAEDAWWEVTRY